MKTYFLALLVLCLGLARCESQTQRTQTHGTYPVPHATGENPDPLWIAHPYWDKYAMPGFWQCPVGYVQVLPDGGVMGASKNGEISGGSEDHKHKPSCRLPRKDEVGR
jgi:hypothetical protein